MSRSKYFYTFRSSHNFRDNNSIFNFRPSSWDTAYSFLKKLSDESSVYKYKLLVIKREL